MCGFDDMDPLEIASIFGLVEAFMDGEREGKEPEEPSPDDLLEVYDPVADDEQNEEKTDYYDDE